MSIKNTPAAAASGTFTYNGVKYDPEQWEEIECNRIFWDPTWNVRREHAEDLAVGDDDKKSEGGTRGYAGLVMSLAIEPQRDPGTVRPNPDYKKKAGLEGREFLGVCGFQRNDAIEGIASQNQEETEILKDPKAGAMTDIAVAKLARKNPTIKVKVQQLDEFQARALNLKENMQRSSLDTRDVVEGVRRMLQLNKDATSVELSKIVCQSQSFVAKLMRISEGTHNVIVPAGALGDSQKEPKTIFEAWRENPSPTKVTKDEMDTIAKISDPVKRVEAFVKKVKEREVVKATRTPGGGKGKGVQPNNAAELDAPGIGALLYTLRTLGFITMVKPIEGSDAVNACMSAAHRKFSKPLTAQEVGMIADAINKGSVDAGKVPKTPKNASAAETEKALGKGNATGGAAVADAT